MRHTPNYNLKMPIYDEFADVEDLNDNTKIIDAELKKNANSLTQIQQQLTTHLDDNVRHVDYATASGTNAYTATIPNVKTLVEGMSIKVKFTNANTGASTLNINGFGAKEIRKGNGNTLMSGNVKAGQILHLAYTGSNFQILGEGGSGNLQPNQALAGFTFTNDNGEQVGLGDPNLIAANIVQGIKIFGINGAATIQSLGGKGFNSGRTTYTPLSNLTAARQDGTFETISNTVTISNIGFRPSLIVVFGDEFPYNRSGYIPLSIYVAEGLGGIVRTNLLALTMTLAGEGSYPNGSQNGLYYDLKNTNAQCQVRDGSAIIPLLGVVSTYGKLGVRWLAYE